MYIAEDDRIDLYCKAIQCLWNLGNELEGKRQEVEQHTIEVIIEILKVYIYISLFIYFIIEIYESRRSSKSLVWMYNGFKCK